MAIFSRLAWGPPTMLWEKGNQGALGSAGTLLPLGCMQEVNFPFLA